MSLTLRAFGLRVCYFLGYFQERVEKLEAEIAVLKHQNELLGSTTCLYVDRCKFTDCKKWAICGDDCDMVQNNLPHILSCHTCNIRYCEEHAIFESWSITEDESYCKKCK